MLDPLPDAHYGYQGNEHPAYGPCTRCPQMVRIDRIDLLLEHRASCVGRPRVTIHYATPTAFRGRP